MFQPYSGVSTAIIVFTKTNDGGTDNVWFYDVKADGKSLDQKRDLIVNEQIFNDFTLANNTTKEQKEALIKAHKNFNLPQVLDHYRYVKSDLFLKTHNKNGDLLQTDKTTESLSINQFLEDTFTHNFADRTSQSFLVPFAEIK